MHTQLNQSLKYKPTSYSARITRYHMYTTQFHNFFHFWGNLEAEITKLNIDGNILQFSYL